MSEQEIIDNATKHVANAKMALDPERRKKLISESYLGELTHGKIVDNAIANLGPALEVLKKNRPDEYENYKNLLSKLEKESIGLNPKPEPKTEIKVEEKVEPIKTVKKPSKRRSKKK